MLPDKVGGSLHGLGWCQLVRMQAELGEQLVVIVAFYRYLTQMGGVALHLQRSAGRGDKGYFRKVGKHDGEADGVL